MKQDTQDQANITTQHSEQRLCLKQLHEERSPLSVEQRNMLLLQYQPIVSKIARCIVNRLPTCVELDDLLSAGFLGLIDAVEKFDPTRANHFSAYAEFRIKGAILDELRHADWAPRSLRDKQKMLTLVERHYHNKIGRKPSETELAAELNMSVEDIQNLINEIRQIRLISLNERRKGGEDDEGYTIIDCLKDDKLESPLFNCERDHALAHINSAIASLPENLKIMLTLYYFENLNLKQIAAILEVTESRVCQLHQQAVSRIKDQLKKAA